MAKISVVIPLYNQGHFLEDAILSLSRQQLSDWEAIIVNDGSTDDSLQKAEALVSEDRRFKIVSRPNGGLSAARNTGLQNCSGEYIALLDSDDYLLPGHLSQLSSVLDRSPRSVMTAGRIQETDQDLSPIGKLRVRTNDLQEDRLSERLLHANPLARVVWNNPFVPCSQLWRGEYLLKNTYDESLRSNEDWDVLWRAISAGHQVSCSSEIVAYYRRHGNSLNWNIEQMVRTRMITYWKNVGPLQAESVERKCADLSTILSLLALESDSIHRDGLIKEPDYYVDALHQVLADREISDFATLWCCGALRRNRPTSSHVDHQLWERMVRIMLSHPASYRIGARGVFERVRSRF